MTLEALLDAPAPTTSSLTNGDDEFEEMQNGTRPATVESSSLIPHPPAQTSRLSRTRVKEACMELLCILIQQDVNGFFHFPLKQDPSVSSLRGLERLILSDKLTSLSEFKKRIDQLFTKTHVTNPMVATEASRLVSIANQWFSSLVDTTLWKDDDSFVEKEDDPDAADSLRLLNPGNRGIVSATECVRTIGEEVGPLAFGTHLSQYGGYHEDRRNKVIPYTYLNYGPFASFGPAFDSGASNCSPEANQLLLGTSWRPARLLYVNRKEETDMTTEEEEEDISPWSHLVAENDPELQAILADCEAEWQEGLRQARELDAIMPPAGCGDDFSLYLANALLKGVAETEAKAEDEKDPKDYEQKSEVKKTTAVDMTLVPEVSSNSQLLSESAALLRQLFCSQYCRLSDSSVGSERSLRPSQEEITTADRLVDRLTGLISQTTPSEVCSLDAVRRNLGITHLPLSPAALLDVDDSKC